MNRSHQVLLVEDDPLIAKTLVMSLRYEGFELTVATTVRQAAAVLVQRSFDLVMFDVGLPDGSGIDLCRELRMRDAGVPILMLSARTDEETAVAGIEGGADDYIRKPYGIKELTARMSRLLDRGGRRSPARLSMAFGGIEVDVQRHTASVDGIELQLGKKEFEILQLLVRAQGAAITRDQILSTFGDSSAIYDRTIDSHLSHLRKKLKDAGCAARIVAIYGVGYRMEAA